MLFLLPSTFTPFKKLFNFASLSSIIPIILYWSPFSFLISLIIDEAQSPAPIIKTLYLPSVLSAEVYVINLVITLRDNLTPVTNSIINIPAVILTIAEREFGINNINIVLTTHADTVAIIDCISSYDPALIQIELYILHLFKNNT